MDLKGFLKYESKPPVEVVAIFNLCVFPCKSGFLHVIYHPCILIIVSCVFTLTSSVHLASKIAGLKSSSSLSLSSPLSCPWSATVRLNKPGRFLLLRKDQIDLVDEYSRHFEFPGYEIVYKPPKVRKYANKY